MTVRGIRGATVAIEDHGSAILGATRDLLQAILAANPVHPDDIASVFFTVTEDISSTYPALAARELGWQNVPLLCSREIPVPGSLPLCIRVLIHWNTDLPQKAIQHVYLGEAAILRPDLTPDKSQIELED